MTTFTTTYYAYDKSHRMTVQYPGALTGESHYFTHNERDLLTQIRDLGGSPNDTNRYFTYNGVGERVWAVDGMSTAQPTYFTYDGTKILTEKDTSGVAIGRYRNNDSPVVGPALEVVTSDVVHEDIYTFNLACDHSGSVISSYQDSTHNVAYVRDVFLRQVYATVANGAFASRLGAGSGDGFLRTTTTEEFYVASFGALYATAPAVFVHEALNALETTALATALLGVIGAVGPWALLQDPTKLKQHRAYVKTRVAYHWEHTATGHCGSLSVVLKATPKGFGTRTFQGYEKGGNPEEVTNSAVKVEFLIRTTKGCWWTWRLIKTVYFDYYIDNVLIYTVKSDVPQDEVDQQWVPDDYSVPDVTTTTLTVSGRKYDAWQASKQRPADNARLAGLDPVTPPTPDDVNLK